MEKKAIVVKDYNTPYHDPLKLKKGDEVEVSPKESDWPGWVWCTNEEDKGGWVPTSYLYDYREKIVALRDYDATELDVVKGETVTILYEESGWGWCRKESGECGWLPLENLEINQ
jgi:uncharacterized protein YgiM (DUF1202 family)